MAYWLYSIEAFPAPWQPGRVPEFIQVDGIQLPPLEAKTWFKLPEKSSRKLYADYQDRIGSDHIVFDWQMADFINAHWAKRGVVVVHEREKDANQENIETDAAKANVEFRRGVIEQFEFQLKERQVTGYGRNQPTPYELECYELIGLPKPYSIEAYRAERMPGDVAAAKIADAIERALHDSQLAEDIKRAAIDRNPAAPLPAQLAGLKE